MYKQRLEDILNDIIMISEIAELSVEAESIVNVLGIKPIGSFGEDAPSTEMETHTPVKPRSATVQWSEVTFKQDDNTSLLGSDIDLTERGTEKVDVEEEMYSEVMNDGGEDEEEADERTGFYDSSSHLPIMDLLDKWDDPVSKKNKVGQRRPVVKVPFLK
jgi:hypothetical protein